ADEGEPVEDAAQPAFAALVEVGEAGAVEGRGESADARADRHLIVVEDDQKLLFKMSRIIEGLEDDSRRKGAVAHNRDAIAPRMAEKLIADFEAQRGGGGATRMAGHEQIVRAFLRIGVAHQAAAGPHRVEAV